MLLAQVDPVGLVLFWVVVVLAAFTAFLVIVFK